MDVLAEWGEGEDQPRHIRIGWVVDLLVARIDQSKELAGRDRAGGATRPLRFGREATTP